ncbi:MULTISPECIES: MerR family transcriptional regulator [Streptomyces]|uniref:MerR family transcriptional regulator n=1 Tax=Streptomyces achmelvichensis TaxID=3134111 RepID=A0ACC6PUH7_9ACTN|nr:MerR family transcriptional regulator [Streptomyces sp. NBC_01167]
MDGQRGGGGTEEGGLLDIAEVARSTGVAPSALRYYERLGLVEPAGRHGLRRTYRPEVLDRVALIVGARATGFSLAELSDLLAAPPGELRARLAGKVDEIDRRIEEMRTARARIGHALTCRHPTLLDCPTFRAGLRELLPEVSGEPAPRLPG